jgi:hypothetical protein
MPPVSTVHLKVPEIPKPVLPVTFFYCRLIGSSADTPSMLPCSGSVVPATIDPMPRLPLCPPNYFDIVDEKNLYMSSQSPGDRVKARSQGKLIGSV